MRPGARARRPDDLAAGIRARPSRPHQQHGRTLRHLERRLGRAARSSRDPAIALRRQHLLSAPRHAGLLRSQHRRRRRSASRPGGSRATPTPPTTARCSSRSRRRFSATWLLARHLPDARLPSIVAAILFAFCPYFFSHSAHIQLLMAGGHSARRCWCCTGWWTRPRRGAASLLGVALAAQALAVRLLRHLRRADGRLRRAVLALRRGACGAIAAFWTAVALAARRRVRRRRCRSFCPTSSCSGRRLRADRWTTRARYSATLAELSGVAGARASTGCLRWRGNWDGHGRSAVPRLARRSCSALLGHRRDCAAIRPATGAAARRSRDGDALRLARRARVLGIVRTAGRVSTRCSIGSCRCSRSCARRRASGCSSCSCSRSSRRSR